MIGLAIPEVIALWCAVALYALGCMIALIAVALDRRPERTLLALLGLGLVAQTLSLGLRWVRIGHLPVSNMYEALSANVWGMMVAVVFGYWLLPRVRPFAAFVMPVVVLVMGWMLLLPPVDSTLPATYDTVWLFIHIAFYKLFLGVALIALGLAGIVLARRWPPMAVRLERLPDDPGLIELAYRFMGLGLIFDTLGILSGAIWAQDAWGAYWSWDPLEIWSLLTWIALALAIHLRATHRPSAPMAAALVVAAFTVAFLTFFGVPFLSGAVHKGAV